MSQIVNDNFWLVKGLASFWREISRLVAGTIRPGRKLAGPRRVFRGFEHAHDPPRQMGRAQIITNISELVVHVSFQESSKAVEIGAGFDVADHGHERGRI